MAELTDVERSAVGTPEEWSAKDMLVHVGEWKARMAQAIDAVARGQTAPEYDDIDHVNPEIFEEHRCLSWPDVLALLRQGSTHLIDRVQGLTEDDLLDTEPPRGQEGRPLWNVSWQRVRSPAPPPCPVPSPTRPR